MRSKVVAAMFSDLSDEELRERYNRAWKPNVWGDELLRRIHARDREALGMSADNPRLREP